MTDEQLDAHSATCGYLGQREACEALLADLDNLQTSWAAGLFADPTPYEVLDAMRLLVQVRLYAVNKVLSDEQEAPDA